MLKKFITNVKHNKIKDLIMKTDSINHNNIAFGVSQKDIPAVKKPVNQ